MKTHDTIQSNGSESNSSKDRISSAGLEATATTTPLADGLETSDLRREERNLKALAEELLRWATLARVVNPEPDRMT